MKQDAIAVRLTGNECRIYRKEGTADNPLSADEIAVNNLVKTYSKEIESLQSDLTEANKAVVGLSEAMKVSNKQVCHSDLIENALSIYSEAIERAKGAKK